eukprot:GFUD01008308.1.p1 GENE.GFUD01008308.1~~GFUD01008308.1.p1  ORF type:complete len:445 (+),score=149.66 GFUD01008308.1:53-1387(+)
MAGRNPLKDKLEDEELDLSMMQLTDVPVRDIEHLGTKVLTVNLSHNLLTTLPANFPLLSHITKLDLSKNQLVELPENFGGFKSLKSLDLYANQLVKLPVSFAQLKNLKWLDLKDNPLCPALKQAAGDCITPNDCAMCAKKVVALLQSMESQLQRERQRRMAEEMAQQKEIERREEIEREKVRQEKRAAKEKRREEARVREAETKKDSDQKVRHEMQLNGNDNAKTKNNSHGSNGHAATPDPAVSRSCLGSLVMFLLGLAVVALGLAVSLIWIYTEGRLDSKSVTTALPVIQSDVEDYLMAVGFKTVKLYEQAEKAAKPYVESSLKSGKAAWKDGGHYMRKGAKYVETNYGDLFVNIWEQAKAAFGFIWSYVLIGWRSILPYLQQAWEASKPYFHQLGKIIIEKSLEFWDFLQSNFPAFIDSVTELVGTVSQVAVKSWQKITEAF